MSNQKAYSLIELMMFFAITAIIYKGLVGAKSLLDNSYLKSIVKEIKYFENATIKFYNKYNFIPGDFADITSLSPSDKLIAGNEDGSISNLSESLQFWLHLKEGKFIEGNFDGISYFPASNDIIGGLPESKVAKNLIYKIEINSITGKVSLIIAQYSKDGKNSAYFTPSEAADIIKLLQDFGKENIYIKAFDGENVIEGSCLRDNIYNLKNSKKACYIKYDFLGFRQKENNKIDNLYYSKCDGSVIGTIRKSDNQICPNGTEGYVNQICSKEGIWVNYNFDCREVKCSDSLYLNEITKISCPANSTNYNEFRCNETGILENNLNIMSDNCKADYNCSDIGKYRNLACPIGYNEFNSKWLQICDNDNKWKDQTKNCIKLNSTCNLGQERDNISLTNICPLIGYKQTNLNPIEACIFTPNGVEWRLIKDNCLPDYGSGNCSLNDIRMLSCPKGKKGYVKQICNEAGYYETVKDKCIIAKCGKYKIGSLKIKDGYNCPSDHIGQIMEICDYEDGSDMHNAVWKISYQNCQKLRCPSISDNVGNHNFWPESLANNLVEVICNNNIDKAVRFCQPNGEWSNIADKSCP